MRPYTSTRHKELNKPIEYQCRRQNTAEQKIEDSLGITAKIDYQKPNPPN